MITGEKYDQAAQKAYEFLKRMLDPAAWEVRPYYGAPYGPDYAYKLMWGGAKEIPDDARRVDPQYIKPAQYYYPGYNGVMEGTFRLPEGEDPRGFAAAVYRVSGSSRSLECYCPLLTKVDDDGTIRHTWRTGRLVESWEYYLKSYDRSEPYMSDGAGGFVPWEKPEGGGSPTKYYRTAFSTSKVVYWSWAKEKVGGGGGNYAYEIELVRKDWTVTLTDEARESYLAKPSPRPQEGYLRRDYLGMAAMETFTVHDLIARATVHEKYSGWIGRDDLPLPTPALPDFTTGTPDKIQSQSFRLPEPGKRHKGFIEYGYSRFLDYKIHLYALVLGDAEYLNAETALWSDIIYDLPAVPPPVPPLAEEIIDIAVMLGESTSKRNVTFLSTVDAPEGARIAIQGDSDTTADNMGYLSEKFSHATYQAVFRAPKTDFTYILRAGEVQTPPLPMVGRPATSNVYQFIAAGDPQITNDRSAAAWQNSLTQAFARYPEANFIATLGDNVDAQVDMSLAEQQFSDFLAPAEMKSHPLLVVMGNHDDNMGFAGHFLPPRQSAYGVAGGQGDYWTKFENTLFLVLNTNAKGERIQEHVTFLEESIATYRNLYGRPKWIIVLFHHSIFQPTSTAQETQYVDLRDALAPSFSQNRVDLVLMGHVHSYCRTHVLDCDQAPPGGAVTEAVVVPNSGGSEFTKVAHGQTLYVTLNSASGSKFYPLAGDHWYAAKTNQELIPHISHVDVDPARIVITTHRTDNMEIIDQFTLRK